MQNEIRKIINFGGNKAVTLPRAILESLELNAGDYIKVKMDEENKSIIITKLEV